MAELAATDGQDLLTPSERRMTFPTNIVTAIVLALIGYWAGVQIGESFGFNDSHNTGVILGYMLASILFLVGIGFANYPFQRLFGLAISQSKPRPQGHRCSVPGCDAHGDAVRRNRRDAHSHQPARSNDTHLPA
jgi:hypothetical protein